MEHHGKVDSAVGTSHAKEGTVPPKTVRPTGNKVLVRRKSPEEKTPGGIIIPENAKEKPAEGEVIAVGPGSAVQGFMELRPVGVKIGEVVLFGRYSGTEIKVGGVEHVIIMEDDVLGVIEPVTAIEPKPS